MKWGLIAIVCVLILPFLLPSVCGELETVNSGSCCSVQGMKTGTPGPSLLGARGSLSNGDYGSSQPLSSQWHFLFSFFSFFCILIQ